MLKSKCLLLLICLTGLFALATKPRTQSSVKKEQSQLKQQMARTERDIRDNQATTRRHLNQLNSLNSDLAATNAAIATINDEIATLNRREKRITDSISRTEARIDTIKTQCTKVLRDSRRRRQSLSDLSLVFSANSFSQAMRRSRYTGKINKLATSKAVELQRRQQELVEKRQALIAIEQRQKAMADSLAASRRTLLAQQAEIQKLVNHLQGQAATLNQVLNEQRSQAQNLDAELDRIIAEERRQAEEKRRAEEKRKAEERRLAEEKRKKEQETAQKNKEQKKNATSAGRGEDAPPVGTHHGASASASASASATASTTASQPASATASAATPKLSGSFANNKGKMPFPVGGHYKIVGDFGVHKHQNLPLVETQNLGIDIEATSGANARAVFDGVVSYIFQSNGFHNVVMVRHGSYVTVYANLDQLSVKKGDTVKCGQALGQIYSDPQDRGRSVLHFEVRYETQKLNPLDWVKR